VTDPIIAAIRQGRRDFVAQFARRDTEDGTAPDWSAPAPVTLYVALRDKAFKKHPVGEILTLTPTGRDWAEYSERDYCGLQHDGTDQPFGEFLIEEWRMRLFL
jgi:hypothetical protein